MKSSKLAIVYAFTILFMISCEKETNITLEKSENKITEIEDLNFKFQYPSDKALTDIKNWINKTSFLEPTSKKFMDFDVKKAVSFKLNGVETIVLPEIKNDLTNKENVAITFMNDGSHLIKGMIVKTIDISKNLKRMEYYNFDNELLFTTELDNLKHRAEIVYETKKKNSQTVSGKLYSCGDSVGEKTAACLGDVYSNHGWLSVWATVQTAFIPATAAALAGACAYDGVTSGGCASGYLSI